MDSNRLRKLAGIDNGVAPEHGVDAAAQSLISGKIGQQKGEYMRKHNIQPGTDEWFKLWFARPTLTGENPTPKK